MEENQNQDVNQGIDTTVPNTVNAPTPSETQNLDVLLQDPKLQAEFDKKMEKAIEDYLNWCSPGWEVRLLQTETLHNVVFKGKTQCIATI